MPRAGKYGAQHTAARAAWVPHVKAGAVTCWRCRCFINPSDAWDLGHDDLEPSLYRGPEHVACNRRAGAIKGNKMRGTQRALQKLERPPTMYTFTDDEL